MAKQDDWIVGFEENGKTLYLKHPRGELTRDPAQAWGYHYKLDASNVGRHILVDVGACVRFSDTFTRRRKECKSITN